MKWNKGMKPKSVRILACMVSKSGNVFKSIKADKESILKPGSVFVTKKHQSSGACEGKALIRTLFMKLL